MKKFNLTFILAFAIIKQKAIAGSKMRRAIFLHPVQREEDSPWKQKYSRLQKTTKNARQNVQVNSVLMTQICEKSFAHS